MVTDYQQRPELTAGADECALKLWQLQGLFRRLAKDWSLRSEISRGWPGLALCRRRLFFASRLELRLQADYLRDGREFYELRFLETGPGVRGLCIRQDFGCGRLLADEILSEKRVVRQLEEKASLLGLLE